MEYSNELAALRLICGESVTSKSHIAGKIGISIHILDSFLKGKSIPRPYNMNKIKKFLDLDKLRINFDKGYSSDEWLEFINYISLKLEV